MMGKFIVVMLISITALGLQIHSCNQRTDEKRVEWGGPNKPTNLVIFFNKDTTNNEIEGFLRDVLRLEEYKIAFEFRLSKDNYKGVGINFSTDATPDQRGQLKKNIRESPIVYKVYENVVPSEVKDL